jgi:RNA polymerase sigma factor (TIGR02999 family)
VNQELRQIANRLFAAERPGHTLQPTAVVNEAWLKMRGLDGGLNLPDLQSRGHFYAIAARVMRQILVDYARQHNAIKRGGGQVKMSLADWDQTEGPREAEVIEVHEALERFKGLWPRAAQVVELRYYAGCTIAEAAAVLGVSPETVKNDWRLAKAWLWQELTPHD